MEFIFLRYTYNISNMIIKNIKLITFNNSGVVKHVGKTELKFTKNRKSIKINGLYRKINNIESKQYNQYDIELSEDNIYQINYFNNKVYIQFTKKQLCIYYMLKIFKVIFLTNKLTIIAQYIINLLKIIFFL